MLGLRRFGARQAELLEAAGKPQWGVAVESSAVGDGTQHGILEAGVAGALAGAELLWSWARVDPEIVRAVAFSSPNPNVHNGFDFVQFIGNHYDGLSPETQAGVFRRLLGYTGEQRYLDLATAHGDSIIKATEPNQPVWDFIVNGHMVNVKTVADVNALHEAALAHADVLYAVPTDATGALTANMVPVTGLDHDQLASQLHDAIATAHGADALSAFTHHIPVVMIGMAMHRGRAQSSAGHDRARVLKHGGIAVVSRSAGAIVGTIIGGHVARSDPPLLVPVGAIGGAAVGALVGQFAFDKYKLRPFEEATAQMERRCRDYWKSSKDVGRLGTLIETELEDRAATSVASRMLGARWRQATAGTVGPRALKMPPSWPPPDSERNL